MKRAIVLAVSLATSLLAMAQAVQAAPVRDAHWALLGNQLFPAMLDLGANTAQAAPALKEVLGQRRARFDACQHETACVLRAASWSDAEIASVATLAAKRPATSWRQVSLADDGVAAQLTRELRGVNSIIAVYGQGAAPRYPKIDGPLETVGSKLFNDSVADAVLLGEACEEEPALALDHSLAIALALLDVNDRSEAVAFEPLEATFNADALARARTLDWRQYRYTAIVVPGMGPENLATPLSARGKLRVRLAAQRFAQGDVAFVMMSGASVHPKGSRFVEAVEMRKALMERYGVPADRIIIEPYARHTTTNLRNATRRLIALGAPLGRDGLVITDVDQSRYIGSPEFDRRNLQELGYQPATIGARISPTELVFRPAAASARMDPKDPLDP